MEFGEVYFSFENFSSINSTSKPIDFLTSHPSFLDALKVLVSISCVLSLLGSSFIILTYAMYKELRTMARHTLVCLSIADLLVALSSLLGILTPTLNELGHLNSQGTSFPDTSALGNWCKTQAAVQVFSTESSIFWTIGVAVFMFALVVIQPKTHRWGVKLLAVLHVICWGVPFVLTVWLLWDGYLWYEANATPGFCAIVGNRTHRPFAEREGEEAVYPIIVGYELWLYIAFIILPVLYISLSCYVRRKTNHIATSMMRATKQDVKLIFVPLIFLILRVWSVIVDITSYYLSPEDRAYFRQTFAAPLFVILEGIGDTAQGAANGVLFCLFTTAIRAKLLQVVCRICCSKGHSEIINEESDHQDEAQQVPAKKDDNRPLLSVGSNSLAHSEYT